MSSSEKMSARLGYNWRQIMSNISLQRGGAMGKETTESLISGKVVMDKHRYIVLFFGCEWHPFCRNEFTPHLIQIYRHLNAQRGDNTDENVEIVYVSLDKDEKAYERFVRTHPWLTVPWDEARELLIAQFRVQNIATKLPKVVVLDTSEEAVKNNGIINKDAFPEIQYRMKGTSDEALAKQFPWGVSKAAHGCTACTALMFCSIQ